MGKFENGKRIKWLYEETEEQKDKMETEEKQEMENSKK